MKYTKLISIIALTILFSCKASFQQLQQEENKYNITTVEQLQDKNYAQKIEDFYAGGTEGTFTGKADVKIYFKIFKQPENEKAAILISTGRTEAAIKYKELIFDLFNNGYSIYIHDHRGQGLSGRMADDPEMGYIDTFQFYIDDMKYFYDNYVKRDNHKKIFLLAHSMGGAIGMTYLEQYQNDFNAAAFSSPMLGLKAPTCGVMKIFHSKTPKYAMGQTGYNDDKVEFKDNHLTGCEVRYYRMVQAFEEAPKAKLGGATSFWVYKSCQQFKYMIKNVDKIKTPFILFSAVNDEVVAVHAHQKFIEKAKKAGVVCTAFTVEDAQHELFIEKDKQRIETVTKMLDYYNQY